MAAAADLSESPFIALDLDHWIAINKRRRCPTQTDRALFLGISRQHLSEIESGKARPGADFIAAVMDTHCVPFDRVFFVDKGRRAR